MRALGLLLLAALAAFPQVKVWEGTLTLPTYQEGLPDPNPPFDIFASSNFNYPYTIRDRLTGERVEQAWRAVFLENEYLKCSVLPDIGGHLYSCTDKVNGREMFYANPSIKKALIGYRGAWAAFGIEFNFPVSHNWMSMSPVDYALVQHGPDKASVWVGNIDRPYGMQWRVELTLRRGSSVLEQRMLLYNRSDVHRRYYWWNNAAVEVKDDARIIYPMRFTASHGFTRVDTWPVSQDGLDLSVMGNQTRGTVSSFTHGSREPFMGVWHPSTNSGVVHYADWGQVPAKKIWSWGADARGREWRDVLSDNNSAYVEVQAGLFRNQETFAFLPPRELLDFTEYWMPVRDIGGFSRANLDGIVHLERSGEALRIGLNVTRTIAGVVRIRAGERVVAEERVQLTPRDAWKKTVPGAPSPATFELVENNRVVLAHTEGVYDFDDPSTIKTGPQEGRRFPPPEERSDGDFFALGTDQELNGNLPAAWATYSDGLRRFPRSFELNRAAGRLAVTLNRWEEALPLLLAAQRMVSNDPETHYYLGIAYNALGETRKARGEWQKARLYRAQRPAAMLQLARLAAREGDRQAALDGIRELLGEFPKDLRAGGMEVALLRHAGRSSDVQTRLKYWLALDPASNMLRYERVKSGAADEALWRHLAADPERVIEIATDYMELALWEDAVELLAREYPEIDPATAEPGTPLPQNYPLVAYYRGYCRERMGQSGRTDFERASKMSTRWVFPHRPGTFAVLRKAAEVNPKDAIARYLLGMLYQAGGQVDNALREWEAARAINSNIPVLHRNLAQSYLLLKNQPERAVEMYREGLRADPTNLEVYTGLDQALSLLGRPAAERAEALARYPDKPNMPANLVYALALALAEGGRADEADRLFEGRFFPREEHGLDARQVRLEVQLRKALDNRTGAAKLADQPYAGNARFLYFAGEAEHRAGNADAARELWQRAVKLGRRGADLAFAYKAAQRLGQDTSELRRRIQQALDGMARPGRNRGSYWYNRGVLEQTLGLPGAADSFRNALLAPDRMLSHYYTRTAMAEK